jgi:hypothetical protein
MMTDMLLESLYLNLDVYVYTYGIDLTHYIIIVCYIWNTLYSLYVIIPIHPVVLHGRSWKFPPGQFVPPWSGAGLVHVRVLFS